MSMAAAQWLVLASVLYGGLGLLFALAFVNFGAQQLDPAASDMPVSVRLLLMPGVAALWPWMLFKWATRSTPPDA